MYTQSFVAAIVAGLLSTAATAAPLNARDNSYDTTTSTVTTSSTSTSVAAPAATSGSYTGPVVPYAQPVATVYPDFTSQYNAKTGAVDFHTANGQVSRSPTNGGADISTLVTFTLDAQYAGNQCQLVFDLASPSSYLSGSNKAQLYTSLAPATADSSSWPSGDLRNQALGTVDLVAGGRALWEAGSGPGATANGYFPCSAIAGHIYGGEVVPQGDAVSVSWPANQDGPKIIVW